MIASVAVAAAVYAIDKPYSYVIPPAMEVSPGMRVIVPFGRSNKKSEAVVLSIEDRSIAGLKPIERVMDLEPVLSDRFLRMAAFLRDRYFCTFYDAIKAMLPAGLWFDTAEVFHLSDDVDESVLRKPPEMARQILQYIQDCGGTCSRNDLKTLTPNDAILSRAIQYLLNKKCIQSNLDFSRKVHDKTEQIAALAVTAEEALAYAARKQRSAPLQAEVLRLMCSAGEGSVKEICYLTGASAVTLRRLEELGYITFSYREVFRNPLPTFVEKAPALILNREQQDAFEYLKKQNRCEKPGIALLYGVTGSGKTAVYLHLIQDALNRGKSALFLVPEIALTPQLIQLLMSHFGDTVAVLHSALRVSERYDEWKRIRQGKARVVIGTRSAIFAPVLDLGLIILDEEQEHTYKSENTPRYHAREVAIYRGSREQALVLLGSATPSLETMYQAKSGVYKLVQLTGRYNGKNLPDVQIVDLKEEIRDGNSSSLSYHLQALLEENIKTDKQSILFLNRRGAGQCMICVECGEVPHCPRCSVTLTYHKTNRRLMCHYCGYSQPAEELCPACGGPMKILGTGTQKVEEELQIRFPHTSILRMDADTVSVSNSHEVILERFQKERIPILVGTQMVTKGLNFPNVTLVGVVDADMSLYVNHYRAFETTFSMLTQVIGRSGRGDQEGKALIQTMTPEHSVIQLAAQQDYDRFYEQELTLRRLHRYPPFGDLATILFMGAFESSTYTSACAFRNKLTALLGQSELREQDIRVLGPSPAAIAKINNTFRYRLTIQCINNKSLRMVIGQMLKEFAKDKKNKGITAIADMNSYE